jgi:hypothetical protein
MDSFLKVDPNPGIVSTEAISPSARRYGLLIFPPSTGSVTISTEPISAVGVGIVLINGAPPLWLCEDTHGSIVHQGFQFLYNAGGHPATWIEVLR